MSKSDLWNREFPITSVTRADLVRAGARRSLVRALTDTQMRAIATKMSEYYVRSEDILSVVAASPLTIDAGPNRELE